MSSLILASALEASLHMTGEVTVCEVRCRLLYACARVSDISTLFVSCRYLMSTGLTVSLKDGPGPIHALTPPPPPNKEVFCDCCGQPLPPDPD